MEYGLLRFTLGQACFQGLPRRFKITEVCQAVVASVAVTAKSRTLRPWSVKGQDLSYVVVCGWQDVLLIVAVCCLRGFRAPLYGDTPADGFAPANCTQISDLQRLEP